MDKLWNKLLNQHTANEFIDYAFKQKKVPELSVLDGVAERTDYHPEGDSGVHMRMVLEQAFKLSEYLPEKRKVRVRAAAALHDLGKAVSGGKTPDGRGQLRIFDPTKASHLEHDKLGLPLVVNVAKRWGLSDEVLDFCQQVAWRHQALHRLCEKDGTLDRGARTMLKNLMISNRETTEKVNPLGLVWRDQEWVEDFALAIQADSFGRLIPESDRVYPQATLLLRVWESLEHSRRHHWPLEELQIMHAMTSITEVLKQWEEEHFPATLTSVPNRPKT